ncbi:MAG: type II secretion system protein [Armatimonadetes bacterium]|nr:type II secretion system protein [Armatimonadota bacterium]
MRRLDRNHSWAEKVICMKNRLRYERGFTLVEMLVVIAITAILFGLIFGPLVQSFNLTRQANTQVEAQDAARIALDQVTRELGDAMIVFDNTGTIRQIRDSITPTEYKTIYVGTGIDLPQPDIRNATDPTRDFSARSITAKIDFIVPDNVLQDAGQPQGIYQPVVPDVEVDAQGNKHQWIVRYFIGLRDPSRRYSNQYLKVNLDNKTYRYNSDQTENTYILYRVQFHPDDPRFHQFDNADGMPQYALPNFFYDKREVNGVPLWRVWKEMSTAMVPTDTVDMVRFDNVLEQLVPGVTLAPTMIPNDSLLPDIVGNDAPTSYKATHAQWTYPFTVGVYHEYQIDFADPNRTVYFNHIYFGQFDPADAHFKIYKYDSATGLNDAVFDVTEYERDPNKTIRLLSNSPGVTNDPMLFTVEPDSGKVNFAMGPVTEDLDPADINNEMFNPQVGSRRVTVPIYKKIIGAAQVNTLARLVVGKIQVIGPNALAPQSDPAYGQAIPYRRVNASPGPNEYAVDYVRNEIYFNEETQGDLPTRRRNSGGEIVDVEPVKVTYFFQTNQPNDLVRADYHTKSLITLNLAVRKYDRASSTAQLLELTDKIRVRNVVR